jgi:hypothetical protein
MQRCPHDCSVDISSTAHLQNNLRLSAVREEIEWMSGGNYENTGGLSSVVGMYQ